MQKLPCIERHLIAGPALIYQVLIAQGTRYDNRGLHGHKAGAHPVWNIFAGIAICCQDNAVRGNLCILSTQVKAAVGL